ncbi:YkvA family protein [Ornithinicoccus halotolerans]|uniref:YkvA family protein n=1 Tax=Ornithinicoccus halotolerans TaxID=1748220 RepID=UPI001296E73C|nr:YkvA family protein [Ornithinicoccus halotolerans]
MATTTARRFRWKALLGVASAARSVARPGSPGLGERLAALPRLVAAVRRGDYAGADLKRLLLMAGATGYVVSPVDLVPEGLLGVFGIGDDLVVVSWLAVSLVNLTDDFLAWEHEHGRGPGEVIDGEAS